MRSTSPGTALFVAGLALSVLACTDGGACPGVQSPDASETGPEPDATSAMDGVVGPESDAANGASSDREPDSTQPAPSLSFLRVANWSSDAPPIDMCIAPHATSAFQGPLLAGLTAALDEGGIVDGGEAALPFPETSAYLLVAAGAYDARLVVAGASDCSASVVADETDLPPVAVGTAMTVALVGAAHPVGMQPGLRMIGLLDDNQAPAMVALRVVNASPDIALVDVGTVTAGVFAPLLASVPFGFASPFVPAEASRPAVDSNGYASVPALTRATLHVRPSGTSTDSTVSKSVSIAAGAIVTLVVAGPGAQSETDALVPIAQIVEIIDNAGTLDNVASWSLIAP